MLKVRFERLSGGYVVQHTRAISGGARNSVPEPWAVEWTNDLGDFRHVHYTKRAAQRQVTNTLKLLQPDQSENDVLERSGR